MNQVVFIFGSLRFAVARCVLWLNQPQPRARSAKFHRGIPATENFPKSPAKSESRTETKSRIRNPRARIPIKRGGLSILEASGLREKASSPTRESWRAYVYLLSATLD